MVQTCDKILGFTHNKEYILKLYSTSFSAIGQNPNEHGQFLKLWGTFIYCCWVSTLEQPLRR